MSASSKVVRAFENVNLDASLHRLNPEIFLHHNPGQEEMNMLPLTNNQKSDGPDVLSQETANEEEETWSIIRFDSVSVEEPHYDEKHGPDVKAVDHKVWCASHACLRSAMKMKKPSKEEQEDSS